MNPKDRTWTDPLAMWHNAKSTIGFADGHAEMHTWESKSFIEWCQKAMNTARRTSHLAMTSPADDMADMDFMAKGFPYKSLR